MKQFKCEQKWALAHLKLLPLSYAFKNHMLYIHKYMCVYVFLCVNRI